MSWNDNLSNLVYVLADLYPFKEDSYSVVKRAYLPAGQIGFSNKATSTWTEILNHANRLKKVPSIIDIALHDYPGDQFLISAKKGTLTPVQPIVDDSFSWGSTETIDTFEKLMGRQSTLLPIHWLEVGLLRAKSVAKVVLSNNQYGTGFLTHRNIFVTNHHVIPNPEVARTTIIKFNYRYDSDGLGYEEKNFKLDPDTYFKTCKEKDWTFVQVKEDANSEWGAIDIQPVDITVNHRANIIQHPGGEAQQIAVYHNIVAYVDETIIQYLTDTLPGSSGSPVFDSDWNVIALHHKGGLIIEPATKSKVHRNEGININCLLGDIDFMNR